MEEILDERIHRGRKQYFVKWKGYPDSENCWEDEDNCSNSPDKIQEFRDRRLRALEGDTVRKRSRRTFSRAKKRARHAASRYEPLLGDKEGKDRVEYLVF